MLTATLEVVLSVTVGVTVYFAAVLGLFNSSIPLVQRALE